jgi:hypothetical protein
VSHAEAQRRRVHPLCASAPLRETLSSSPWPEGNSKATRRRHRIVTNESLPVYSGCIPQLRSFSIQSEIRLNKESHAEAQRRRVRPLCASAPLRETLSSSPWPGSPAKSRVAPLLAPARHAKCVLDVTPILQTTCDRSIKLAYTNQFPKSVQFCPVLFSSLNLLQPPQTGDESPALVAALGALARCGNVWRKWLPLHSAFGNRQSAFAKATGQR